MTSECPVTIKKLPKHFWLLIAISVVVIVRLWLIFGVRKHPATDEIWALMLTKASFIEIWNAAFSELHAPFYFLFLHALGFIYPFEITINNLRLISLFFELLASVSIYYVALLLFNKKIAAIAFALSLILLSLLWTGVYARYYSLLVLLTILAIFYFRLFLIRPEIKFLIILTLISGVGVYTHYYFGLVDVSFLVFLLVSKKYRKLLKYWGFKIFANIILLSPALYFFLSVPKPDIAGRHTNDILKIPAIFLANFTSWESLVFLYYRGNSIVYFPILAVLSVSALLLLVNGYRHRKSDFKNVILLLLLIPPSVATLFSYTIKPLLAVNSLVIFEPAYILLLANGIYCDLKSRKILTIIFLISLIFSMVFFIQSSFSLSEPRRDFYLILSQFREGDIIVHSHLYSWLNGVYYFGKDNNFILDHRQISTPQVKGSLRIKSTSETDLVRENRRVWLVEPQGENEEIKSFKSKLMENFVVEREQIYPWRNGKFQEYYFNVYLFVTNN